MARKVPKEGIPTKDTVSGIEYSSRVAAAEAIAPEFGLDAKDSLAYYFIVRMSPTRLVDVDNVKVSEPATNMKSSFALRQLTIKGSFIQRQPDGTEIGIEFHGVIDNQMGNIDEVSAVVLEGEMHGNDGKTRVHLFLQ